MKKVIYFLTFCLFILLFIIGGSFYLTTQKKINENNLPSENIFYVTAPLQSLIYPYRNWGVKDPIISARSALMVDLETNYVFFQKNPHQRWPIASLTKLMTALIVKKYLNLELPAIITKDLLSIEGDSFSLKEGDQLRTEDLLRIMLLYSSNKAAIALSKVDSSLNFVQLMNKEAKNLNLTQTTFVDVTGLNPLNQSTVGDLRNFASFLFKNYPEIFLILQNEKVEIESLKGNHYLVKNINLFSQKPKILEELGIYYLGGKTGFIEEAKETFLGIFSYPSQKMINQSRNILIIVLNSDSRYNDIETLLRWLKSAYVF